MIRTRLAVVISSVLFAAFATQAQPAQPDQQPETTAPTQGSTSQDADTSTRGNDDVGSPDSNVDEHATSGAYYPYSAGTAGDDPEQPKSTSVPADAGDGSSAKAAGSTDQWQNADSDGDGYLSQDELKKVAPALADNFDDIDVDGDDKLTRGEFRTWHESQKARMDADQGARPSESAPAPASPSTPEQATAPADESGE